MTCDSSIRQTSRAVLPLQNLRPIDYNIEYEELELSLQLLEKHQQKLCEKVFDFLKLSLKWKSVRITKERNLLKKEVLTKENVSNANNQKLQNQKTLKLFKLFLTQILFHMILSFNFIQIYSQLFIHFLKYIFIFRFNIETEFHSF